MSEGIFHCHHLGGGCRGGGYRRATDTQLEESRHAAKCAIFTKKNYLTSNVTRADVNKLCSEGLILGKEAAHFP